MKKPKVYHVDVKIDNLVVRLYFPSAQMRKVFCLTHASVVIKSGRRPLIATDSDLQRTRLNIGYYSDLADFIPIWDAFVK